MFFTPESSDTLFISFFFFSLKHHPVDGCHYLFVSGFSAAGRQERLLGLQGGGTGGGGGDSEEARMLAGLAPEGTREWHDRRSGMPAGATKTVVPGQYEQVVHRMEFASPAAAAAVHKRSKYLSR